MTNAQQANALIDKLEQATEQLTNALTGALPPSLKRENVRQQMKDALHNYTSVVLSLARLKSEDSK